MQIIYFFSFLCNNFCDARSAATPPKKHSFMLYYTFFIGSHKI